MLAPRFVATKETVGAGGPISARGELTIGGIAGALATTGLFMSSIQWSGSGIPPALVGTHL